MKSILRLLNVMAVTVLIAAFLTACGGGGNGGGGNGGGGNGGVTSPNAPNSLSSTVVSSSQIDLFWTDNSTNESGFKIERKTESAGTYTEIVTVSANVTSYSDTGLNASTTYYYRLRAYNSSGNSSYSNEASATTASYIVGAIVKHEQSDFLPYSYYHYVPASSLNKPVVALVLVATAGPNPATSYTQVEEYALQALKNLQINYGEPSGLVMFTIAIPAGMQGVDWDQTGSAQTLHRTNFETTSEMYFRPDLKFLDVLNHFKTLLANAGFVVDPQIFVTGFSSGGMWTNRIALLYPDLIKAAAPGAAGGLWTMPLDSYQATQLPYHMGVQDLESLGLSPFDVDNFKKIPFFVFTGSEDNNDALDCGVGNGCSGLEWDQIVFYKNSFGYTVVERAEFFHNQLIALGMNSTFWSYDGVGHWWSEDMKTDIINFFSSLPLTSPEL